MWKRPSKHWEQTYNLRIFLCSYSSISKSILLADIVSSADNIYRAEAKRVLNAQAISEPSEIEYLLEYYSLVKEGKTNYISTCAFHDITGQHPQEPVDFFKVYAAEFKPEHPSKKRKTNGK